MLKIILILIAIVSVGSFTWWTWKRRIKKPKSGKIENLEKAKMLGLITDEEFLRLKAQRSDNELKEYLKKKK